MGKVTEKRKLEKESPQQGGRGGRRMRAGRLWVTRQVAATSWP